MKESKYIPISKRKNITDKKIAKVVDYLERHSKDFRFTCLENHYDILFDYKYFLSIREYSFNISPLDSKSKIQLGGSNQFLFDNIVGIYGNIRKANKS